MQQLPPDIDTCKRIIESPKLRAERAVEEGVVSLITTGLMIVLLILNGKPRMIEGNWFLSLRGVFYLFGVIVFIYNAYRNFTVTKEDKAIRWLAMDFLSKHYASGAIREAEQAVPPNAP